jgi:hypothetical protein
MLWLPPAEHPVEGNYGICLSDMAGGVCEDGSETLPADAADNLDMARRYDDIARAVAYCLSL